MIALLTVEEVANALKLDKRAVYELLKTKQIKGLKVLRKWRVSSNSLSEFVSGQLESNGLRTPCAQVQKGPVL